MFSFLKFQKKEFQKIFWKSFIFKTNFFFFENVFENFLIEKKTFCLVF